MRTKKKMLFENQLFLIVRTWNGMPQNYQLFTRANLVINWLWDVFRQDFRRGESFKIYLIPLKRHLGELDNFPNMSFSDFESFELFLDAFEEKMMFDLDICDEESALDNKAFFLVEKRKINAKRFELIWVFDTDEVDIKALRREFNEKRVSLKVTHVDSKNQTRTIELNNKMELEQMIRDGRIKLDLFKN